MPWGDNGTIVIWVRESAAAIKIRVRLACFETASPQKKRPQHGGNAGFGVAPFGLVKLAERLFPVVGTYRGAGSRVVAFGRNAPHSLGRKKTCPAGWRPQGAGTVIHLSQIVASPALLWRPETRRNELPARQQFCGREFFMPLASGRDDPVHSGGKSESVPPLGTRNRGIVRASRFGGGPSHAAHLAHQGPQSRPG